MKIEILSTETFTSSGVDDETGRKWSMTKQVGYVHLTDKPFPVEIRITMDDSQAPYAPGMYNLAESSFWVGGNGSLRIRPRLVPVQDNKQKVA